MKQEHSEGGEEDRTELQNQEDSEDDDWSGVVPPCDIAMAVAEYRGTQLCSLHFKTLPEAQRTQGIESITQIITHGKKYFRGEMK